MAILHNVLHNAKQFSRNVFWKKRNTYYIYLVNKLQLRETFIYF